jgi:hypothetical protein
MRAEMKRAAGREPTAKHSYQVTRYASRTAPSRPDLLERAGDVLLLLQHDLSQGERAGFALLLERRLARVYDSGDGAGSTNGGQGVLRHG